MNLITGGTGIVGARLAFDLLKKGVSVRCTKRSSSDTDFVKDVFIFYDKESGEEHFNQIEWWDADLLDVYQLESAIEGVETIYHAAALVSYHKKDRHKLIETNARGTANLINVSLGAGIKSFCHISSVAALGAPNELGLTDENSKWNRSRVRSNYALSKYLAEKEVWRGYGEGLKVTVVNPSVILGPAKADQSSGSLMDLLKKGISYYPNGKTGFVDVRDVSKMCLALVEKEIYGERFVLNSENVSYKSLLQLAADIYGNKYPKIQVGRLELEMVRLVDALRSSLTNTWPKITSETVKSALQNNFFSNEKIKSELNDEFIPVKESLQFFSNFSARPL